MLRNVAERMECLGVSLRVTDQALDLLSRQGFEPDYGARPLRRTIRAQVEDPVAELLLSGALTRGGRAVVDVDGDALTVTPEQAVPAVPDHPLETQTQQDRSF